MAEEEKGHESRSGLVFRPGDNPSDPSEITEQKVFDLLEKADLLPDLKLSDFVPGRPLDEDDEDEGEEITSLAQLMAMKPKR